MLFFNFLFLNSARRGVEEAYLKFQAKSVNNEETFQRIKRWRERKRIGEGMRSRDREKVEGGETGKEQERGGKEWERE